MFFVLGLQYSGKIMMLLMAQAPHISESSLNNFDNAIKTPSSMKSTKQCSEANIFFLGPRGPYGIPSLVS